MNYDEQAYLEYTDGQNDALALESPASNDYYYLMGWHDTKQELTQGKPETCRAFKQVSAEIERRTNWSYSEDWEEF